MVLAYLVCILTVSSPVAADHKSFTIDQARIEATVTPSGDMDVSASRHFTFNGDFSAIYWGLGTPLSRHKNWPRLVMSSAGARVNRAPPSKISTGRSGQTRP